MKKLYFGTNLKMYKTVQETVDFLKLLQALTQDLDRAETELFVIPSYTALQKGAACRESKYIKIGAQNMCWEMEGQFTGEISPRMLKELAVDLVMIGHSERRHVFGETNVDTNRKVCAALENGFTTLLCVGETESEKNYGIATEVLRTQLKVGCHRVRKGQLDRLMIAYEPVWSIGVNGTPASAEYAQMIHHEIRLCLTEMFGDDIKQIPILYGGSVNRGNAQELIVQPEIDGLFVGRSAWQAEQFEQLIREAIDAYRKIGG